MRSMTTGSSHSDALYPACRAIVGPRRWRELCSDVPGFPSPEAFAGPDLGGLPPWLPDLARIEEQVQSAAARQEVLDREPAALSVNPTLALLRVGWRGLPAMLDDRRRDPARPVAGEEHVLVRLRPATRKPLVSSASADELLALKIVVENLDRRQVAREHHTTLAALDRAVERAVRSGILRRPGSALRRDSSLFDGREAEQEAFCTARVFTLQWHITQACDLSCRHCYDRSARAAVTQEEAEHVLDQLYDFCQDRHVYGQVSFSGGNPLLHPRFFEIYQAAADRGFMTAILGNPVSPEVLARIKAVRVPEFYQVSLEGLREHNDFIRGAGFFDRVMRFLDDLRAAGIYSMVMLTLTRGNLDQVIPLGERLRGRADLFTFNRLSTVGEGAQLQTPGREEYERFLRDYLAARQANPVMGVKDNLINIVRQQQGEELFGGCTGFGCGAAFNFAALLPDGEVHACRKFSSPIGSIRKQTLAEVYDSAAADRYRKRPAACRECRIRHVCGGCLAVTASQGLDISRDVDPCCFLA